MASSFGLSYLDALSKSLQIVKQDALHIMDEDNKLSAKCQIEYLVNAYQFIDPDSALKKFDAIESNRTVLREEVKYAMTAHFMNLRKIKMAGQNNLRFHHLMRKYNLGQKNRYEPPYILSALFIPFPDIEYKLKLEHPQLYNPIPDGLKAYKNFKKEYDLDGVFGILPIGKKYGGFVKAYFHLMLLHSKYDFSASSAIFHNNLGRLRAIYKSQIFSQEERIKLFNELDVKDEDCALWSRLFDQQYPWYKDLHKFFGQVE